MGGDTAWLQGCDLPCALRLRALLHQSPRKFDRPTSLWTLDLAAEVSFEQGLTPTWVSDETIHPTLKRLGIGWKRAKQWITSPDSPYARKKCVRPPDPPDSSHPTLGAGFPGRGLVESFGAAGLSIWAEPDQPIRLVELACLLSAEEVIDRVYAAFGCEPVPHLVIPAKVT